MPMVARTESQSGTAGEGAVVDSGDDARSREGFRRRIEFLQGVASHILPWWNGRAERCGFPLIPDGWKPWPNIHDRPGDGVHNRMCFFNAKYTNREHGHPLVLGVHFAWSQLGQAINKQDMTKLPLGHAVNLDHKGRIVDITWGAIPQSTGIMVGRAFAIAPTSDLKTYVKDFGFTL